MCYWILTSKGTVVARSTVGTISPDELGTDVIKENIKAFDINVNSKLGSDESEGSHPSIDGTDSPEDMWDEDDDYYQAEPEGDMPEADDFTPDAFDVYISAQVQLPKNDALVSGKVIGRKRDANDNPIGVSNSNPILDTRVYEVEFGDGHVEEFAANVIAESIYSQVDDEGNEFLILKEISDHKKDATAVHIDDRYTTDSNGRQHDRRTTVGWKLLLVWKDGTTSWEPLRNLKESHPVQVAEYAVANKLVAEPAFAWWVKDVLRRRERIIKAVKNRYWKRTHKFGVEVPKTVEQALALDKETGTDLWRAAIDKEMKNVTIAFEFLDEESQVPVGYKWIPCHIVFDVKMDFTRKARYVAGGHMTEAPSSITYSSVVSRESVRILFLIAALNDLDVLACDIQNAYLNAPTKEKVWTTAGKEFGSRVQGRNASQNRESTIRAPRKRSSV